VGPSCLAPLFEAFQQKLPDNAKTRARGSQTGEDLPLGIARVPGRPTLLPASDFALPRGFAVSVAASSPSRLFVSTADLTLRLKSAGIPYEPLLNMAIWKPVMVFENGEIPMFQGRFPFPENFEAFMWACRSVGIEAFLEQGVSIQEW
jgi:hypothetical protein